MELMVAAFSLVRGVMLVEINNLKSIKLRRSDMFFLPDTCGETRTMAMWVTVTMTQKRSG
jgi:hypothetical protein